MLGKTKGREKGACWCWMITYWQHGIVVLGEGQNYGPTTGAAGPGLISALPKATSSVVERYPPSFDCAQALHKRLLVQQHLLRWLQMHPCSSEMEKKHRMAGNCEFPFCSDTLSFTFYPRADWGKPLHTRGPGYLYLSMDPNKGWPYFLFYYNLAKITCISSSLQCVPATCSPQPSTAAVAPHCYTV